MKTFNPLAEAYANGDFELAANLQKAAKLAGKLKGEFGSMQTEQWLEKFKTADPSMIRMKDMVRALVSKNDPVLIVGPTGTGKELIAKALHGPREGRFLPINCTGLPEQLIESELFGHLAGAFTGALKESKGLFEEAAQGTIFLDEIGDMPVHLQAKLLRVLQDMKCRKLGANKEYNIHCRFIFATNKDPLWLIKHKLFREDLYWRIAAYRIELSELSCRSADIELIGRSIDPSFEKDWVSSLDEDLEQGNVRQLQAIIKQHQLEREL